MNHFYFYSTQLLNILKKHKELIDLIFEIEKLRQSYLVQPQDILNIQGNANDYTAAVNRLKKDIKTKNDAVLAVVRSKRPNRVFEMVNSLITELNLFEKSYNDDNTLIRLLKEFPEKHTDAYSEKQAKELFSLLECSSLLSQSLKEAEERAKFIISESKKSENEVPLNYLQLRLGTDQDIPLIDDFISVFQRLEGLYNFICYLHKVDKEKNPLLINQVSTGSWYIELLGIKQVVVSTENLLKGIGGFIRDYITGKIDREKFENKCKKAEAFIELMALAKKNGIDNAELGIFKELNPFVENFKSDTTILEINDEEVLKLKKIEKLTILDKSSKRENLLESIQLSIEEGKKNKSK